MTKKRWVEPVVVLHREFKPNVELVCESLKTRYSATSQDGAPACTEQLRRDGFVKSLRDPPATHEYGASCVPFVGNMTFEQFVGGLEKTAAALPSTLAEWHEIEPDLREEYEDQLVWLVRAAARKFREMLPR